jgi:uncharacterized protein YdbL (DUF1318 family)
MNHRLELLSLVAATCIGCIEINIYFPETELREAAEEIVNEVRPDVVSVPAPNGSSGDATQAPSKESAPPAGGEKDETTSGILFSLLGPRIAVAEEKQGEKPDSKKIEIDITSPVIKKIKETIKARYAKLQPFYEKGAIGEGADGYLAARDTDALSLKEKRDVQTLIQEENDDRKSLYTQIAHSNGIDDSLIPDVGKLFSVEWQKKSKAGWWIEKEKDKWEKKPKEKK